MTVWWTGINGLMTAVWVWFVWRHFHPPRSRSMGWKFWHLCLIIVLGMIILVAWLDIFLAFRL
jgi:hypothetical protein